MKYYQDSLPTLEWGTKKCTSFLKKLKGTFHLSLHWIPSGHLKQNNVLRLRSEDRMGDLGLFATTKVTDASASAAAWAWGWNGRKDDAVARHRPRTVYVYQIIDEKVLSEPYHLFAQCPDWVLLRKESNRNAKPSRIVAIPVAIVVLPGTTAYKVNPYMHGDRFERVCPCWQK